MYGSCRPAGRRRCAWFWLCAWRRANGFFTQIGNAHFGWFGTTGSKSRLNFLELLRRRPRRLRHQCRGVGVYAPTCVHVIARLVEHPERRFVGRKAWNAHLEALGIPLHTNGSENDIRCDVTKRKVSVGTLSDVGRDCRDAFLGLAKTCAKLEIAFWDYLGARLAVPGSRVIPCCPKSSSPEPACPDRHDFCPSLAGARVDIQPSQSRRARWRATEGSYHSSDPPPCLSRAVSRHLIKVSLSNGLARKQTAPAFSARARIVFSGNAVMKMNGTRFPWVSNQA
jgi:hypothetical protein